MVPNSIDRRPVAPTGVPSPRKLPTLAYTQDSGQPDPNEPFHYDPYGGDQPQSAQPHEAQPHPMQHQPVQPYPVQPYQQPMMPAYGMPIQPQNGMGTAGLVCGIIGLALSWIWCLGGPLGILGIIFGGIGISKANQGQATNKGSATAGLVCGIVAIGLLIMFIALFAEADFRRYDED